MPDTKLDIEELLSRPRTVAVVGLSDNPARTSNSIARYLIDSGFTIVPVNPNVEEVFGIRSFASVQDIPPDIDVDIVDIFRRPKHTADVVRDVVEWSEGRGQKPVIWTQIGVSSTEAAHVASENGLGYVANRCILVEHQRLVR